jgi:uncharacterized membrane protein YeaQ/YmgE (transglycosylase-associated protein family)
MLDLLWFAIFGLIVGALAKLIMPGKDPGGFLITAVIGMVGSLIGTFIGRSVFGWGPGYSARWIMSILGAIILLAIYRAIAGRRTT